MAVKARRRKKRAVRGKKKARKGARRTKARRKTTRAPKTRKRKVARRKVRRRKAARKKVTRRKAARKKVTRRKAAGRKAPKRKKKKAPKRKKRKAGAAFMMALTPSADLAAVVGIKPLPRTQVIKKLWAYIKRNGLQDKKNRQMINADAKLKPIFRGMKQVSMFKMMALVSKHLK